VLQSLRTLPAALPPGLASLARADAHNSVFGILLQLSAQLQSGRWSRLLAHVLAAHPLAVLQLWRTQRRHASAERDAAYLGLGGGAPCFRAGGGPSLEQLRRAATHAFAAYGALAEALALYAPNYSPAGEIAASPESPAPSPEAGPINPATTGRAGDDRGGQAPSRLRSRLQ
jgi:hypothetical protein